MRPINRHSKDADSDSLKKPSDYCPLCAEKHISTAYALANETGYETPNRQMIVGQLVSGAWHLLERHREMSVKISAIRHLIQQRRESEVDWIPLLAEIDAIASAEAKKNLEEENNNKKEA